MSAPIIGSALLGTSMPMDDPAARALILTGRAEALAEVLGMMRRLRLGLDAEASREVLLEELVAGYGELSRWLLQAVEEATVEAELLEVGSGRSRPD